MTVELIVGAIWFAIGAAGWVIGGKIRGWEEDAALRQAREAEDGAAPTV